MGVLRLVVAGTAVLAVLAAGCGSSPSDPAGGPLGPTEASGNICLGIGTSHVLTDGWPFVQNSSETPAVIDKVGLANPRGLRFITAVAVPTTEDFYGARPGNLIYTTPLPGFRWDERRNAVGDAIPFSPAGSRKWTDLLFVVRLLAKHASDSGVDVWYHVGSQHYRLRTVFGLIVLGPGAGQCKH